ncbi:hypothetical protein HA402_015715 [Bradysia odoriphaga]|nr:hypothetical protein HA402_015715 [Bradysia odoriphaga]
MTTVNKTDDHVNKTRHCAFCLKPIENQAIKLCGKCRKRAYCSRECQKTDWSTEGQGHKNWCHLECGEEDIDWKVCTVPGKGLGIIAKRPLPVLYRIMVDGCCSNENHPGVKDLLPVNGSFGDKFFLNCIGLGENDGGSCLCLRISRANHDCKPNADHWYDETFKAVVLFAQRNIAEGEEITINYQLFDDISGNVSAATSRSVLQNKWGIVCAKDCFCYNTQMQTLIARSRELDEKIFNLASQAKSQQALELVKQLLVNHEILGSSYLNKKRTLYDGFQVAVMRKNTLGAAKKYIKEVYAILSAVLSPESSLVKDKKRLMDDITTHSNYLIH